MNRYDRLEREGWKVRREQELTELLDRSFPMCKLFGHRIVDDLPASCPLRCSNFGKAIEMLRNRGWQRRGDRLGGVHDGEADLVRADVCGDCQAHRSTHVQILRANALAEAEG